MGRNNNKNRKKPRQTQSIQDDYNLKKSLGKLKQSQSGNSGITSTGQNINENLSSGINSSNLTSNIGDTTGHILQINESMNKRYDSLKNDISCIPEKISLSTDNLRNEIDIKLDKKVSDKLFYGAISVVVVIASLFYIFSYNITLQDTKKSSEDLYIIKPKIEVFDKSIESNKQTIDKIKDEIDAFEDSIKNMKRSKN